ncbi:outer membrane beta-barrel protein [Flagellimonas lutimaris]|uniref:outer membrane beta-barrel protein n=1 Tax=Flagellimonas lutimaris TaxID=475082 RepID=UPI003F5CE975
MMGKKNLEQLFKERFQDFQEVPDAKVWSSIEASLDKKQKKRGIPIWWSLGGVAAAVVILLLLINPFAEESAQEQTVTERENTATPNESDISEEKDSKGFNSSDITAEEQKGLAKTSEQESLVQKATQTSKTDFHIGDETAVAVNTTSNSERNGSTEKQQSVNSNLVQSKTILTEKGNDSENNDAIAMNKIDTSSIHQKQSITEADENNNEIAQNTVKKGDVEKKSLYDAIEEQKEVEETVAENKSGKWSVGPSLAPVYFDASGDGSPVGSDFTSNSKSGKLNLSYGLTVAYEVGKKLKIRSGVHRVDYGYSTNDVVFSSTLRAASTDKIANIDYSKNSSTIVVQSKDNAKNTPAINSKEIALSEVPALDGKMVQQLGYIEVPLELNYALLDKKFGVDLIGGVSSLFLVDNSVLLESNELVTEIGKANNINSLNFSANVGMGLNYQFSPKIRINVEPVFKYQLNTFSNVSGNFQPYSIGVYSGFSFRF